MTVVIESVLTTALHETQNISIQNSARDNLLAGIGNFSLTESVHSEVSVHCWRTNVGTVD
jgi:hypothetical protein